jgi:feruloyl esterase
MAAGIVAAIPAEADESAAALPSAAQRCTGLADVHLPNTKVVAATVNTSGSFTVPEGQGGPGEKQPGSVIDNLPGYCSVELVRTNPPANDQIHIEVWLPLGTWNHRFQGVGGGGYVSGISFQNLSTALQAGYAAASTDTGHPAAGGDGSFALTADGQLNWPQITDFAGRAIHEMTVVGKDITARFYRSAANHSYFTGCSMGGRQGLNESQRYPDDYDGIVSGAAAVNFSRVAPAQLWPQIVMLQAKDFMPVCKQEAFRQAAVAACDARDGVTDGVIGNAADCRFDPRTLVGRSTDCGVITATDATVIEAIWRGARTEDGQFLWYGWLPGSDPKYLGGAALPISRAWLQYWVAKNPDFDWETLTLDGFTRMFEQGAAEFSLVDSNDPDLSKFRRGGGKLLMWTGLADPLIPPQSSIAYYDSVVRRSGGQARTDEFARLLLAPGVGHCGPTGTVGPLPTDPLGAVVNWVEHGTAPASIEATKVDPAGNLTQSRPLCAYPLVARYRGQGSVDDAANFECAKDF